MKLLIKYILLILMAFVIFPAFSQEFEVKSLEIDLDDLTARSMPQVDNNGHICAVLKVYAHDEITEVRGEKIGDVINNGLEKIIYIPHDSKKIELHFKNHFPLKIIFDNYRIPSLTGGLTYTLKLKSDLLNVEQSSNSQTRNNSGDNKKENEAQNNVQFESLRNNTESIGLPEKNVPEEFNLTIHEKKIKDTYTALLDKAYLKKHKNNDDYFDESAKMYNSQKFFPEAYQAFIAYSELEKNKKNPNNEMIANAYFNAGMSAYSGNEVDQSADAFKKARLAGYEQPEGYIFEIACWQNIAQTDESREKEALTNILEIAKAGFDKFGLEQPVFINNIMNYYILNREYDSALRIINPIIENNPSVAILYGLRGFIYDRAGNESASVNDYRKSVLLPGADMETLKVAGKKLFQIGTIKLNALEGSGPELQANRQDIKANYFEIARDAAKKAININPNDSDTELLLERIEYALENYF